MTLRAEGVGCDVIRAHRKTVSASKHKISVRALRSYTSLNLPTRDKGFSFVTHLPMEI